MFYVHKGLSFYYNHREDKNLNAFIDLADHFQN